MSVVAHLNDESSDSDSEMEASFRNSESNTEAEFEQAEEFDDQEIPGENEDITAVVMEEEHFAQEQIDDQVDDDRKEQIKRIDSEMKKKLMELKKLMEKGGLEESAAVAEANTEHR